MIINYQNTYFFTATINNWIPLLEKDEYKNIIIDAFRILTFEKRVKIYGFVIMPNHIHIIWYIHEGFWGNLSQGSLLRFTSNSIKKRMKQDRPDFLEKFRVSLKDREYQIWQRNPLSIEIFNDSVFQQKLDYIHNNPIQEKWNLASKPEEYFYSSANFHETGKDNFGFLSNIYLE